MPKPRTPTTTTCLDIADAIELAEILTFIGDWLEGHDTDLLAASLRRFIRTDGYDLSGLRTDLARFAALLGVDNDPDIR